MDHENTDLQFKGGNPGAVKYGNFINYYKFHPVEERLKLLPINIWNSSKPHVALDIGSNAGDLTLGLKHFFEETLTSQISILGIDIDPVLVKRASEKHKNDNITFHCLDIMDLHKRDKIINHYLFTQNASKFDVAFCFSTTMWIHLNYGDEGLIQFLCFISSITKILVIEPQPWKCYKTAVKRMKQNNFVFPFFSDLKIREDVQEQIENILLQNKLEKIFESERTSWDRKLLFFKEIT